MFCWRELTISGGPPVFHWISDGGSVGCGIDLDWDHMQMHRVWERASTDMTGAVFCPVCELFKRKSQ